MSDIDDTEDQDIEEAPETSGDDSEGSGDNTPEEAPAKPINPVLAAMLQQKQDLQDAQQKANTNQLISSLGRAGSTLSQSARGNTNPINTSAFDALDQAAQAPVTQELTKQRSAAQAVETQRQIAVNDPDSPQSKAVQATIQKLYPGKFTPEQLSAVSAADAQDIIFKPLELNEKVMERQQEHADTVDSKKDKADQATKAAQDKAYTAMRKDLESFRGNQSMQQAAVAIQNVDKALALAQSQPTSQNLNLLADEMGKIATGGVPGEHGTQALIPNNLATKLAELKSFALSSPSSADVSEYLKNNVEYLKQVKEISEKGLRTYRGNLAKGYKNRVNPDDYTEALSDYGIGGSTAAPPENEFTPDVVKYAKDHNLSNEQALAIKKQRTGAK